MNDSIVIALGQHVALAKRISGNAIAPAMETWARFSPLKVSVIGADGEYKWIGDDMTPPTDSHSTTT